MKFKLGNGVSVKMNIIDKQRYINDFYSEIIFDPDPQTHVIDLILDEDAMKEYEDNLYSRISIQLGKDGVFEADGSHSALLERRDDLFFELLLADLDKNCFDVFVVFKETYSVKTVCNMVEKLFHNGKIKAHLIDYNEKPLLIDGRKD